MTFSGPSDNLLCLITIAKQTQWSKEQWWKRDLFYRVLCSPLASKCGFRTTKLNNCCMYLMGWDPKKNTTRYFLLQIKWWQNIHPLSNCNYIYFSVVAPACFSKNGGLLWSRWTSYNGHGSNLCLLRQGNNDPSITTTKRRNANVFVTAIILIFHV